MSKVGGVGSQPTPATPQSDQTSTTGRIQDTTQASSARGAQETTGNPQAQSTQQAPAQQPPLPPRQAAQRRAEHHLEGTARQAQLQGTAGPAQPTVHNILRGAKRAGLNQTERQQLQNRLNGMNPQERRQEMRFLQNHVLNTPNADRALRTYLELNTIRDQHPNRISRDTVHTLTLGVAQRRTNTSQGAEGILGQRQAVDAAQAMTRMPQSEFNRLQAALHDAGMRNGRPIRGADPQAERALILKAVAARRDELSNPGILDRFRNFVGQPGRPMANILNYANEIRGMRRRELIDQSSVLDLHVDGKNNALQQRFTDSCVPTSSQMIRAEADPIYARQLHREAIHTINSQNSSIANQQSRWLTREGGVADPRNNPQGVGQGLGLTGWQNILNNHVGQYTNRIYAPQAITNTPQARSAALDDIASRVRQGDDVPFRAQWRDANGNPVGGHAMIISDVRGQGNNQRFLITDPWDGRTFWANRQDLVNGNTTFIPGPPPSRGEISHYFPGTPR